MTIPLRYPDSAPCMAASPRITQRRARYDRVAGLHEPSPRRSLRVPLLLALATLLAGCRPPQPGSAAASGAASPRAVLARIIELRAAQRYSEIQEHIVPEQAAYVADFLVRLDRFLLANQRLLSAIRRDVAIGIPDRVDQGYITDGLGVFGLRVELLDEYIEGEQATVSMLVNGQVPPQIATMRRVAGRWRLDPGPGASPHLLRAFEALARGLNDVAADVEQGRISTADLVRNPEVLLRKLDHALQPGIALLAKARAAALPEQP